jgi:hypothetical protein
MSSVSTATVHQVNIPADSGNIKRLNDKIYTVHEQKGNLTVMNSTEVKGEIQLPE